MCRFFSFVLLFLLVVSCSTYKSIKLESSQNNDLIYESILDYSKTKAKSYKSGSVFGVDFSTEDKKIQIVSISKMEMKYVFKDKQHLKEKPFGGRFLEISNQLYFISTDFDNKIFPDYNLAIKYGMIVFDEERYVDFFLNDFNNDLEKIMFYIYSLEDHKENVKIYTNNWKDYNKVIDQLSCN